MKPTHPQRDRLRQRRREPRGPQQPAIVPAAAWPPPPQPLGTRRCENTAQSGAMRKAVHPNTCHRSGPTVPAMFGCSYKVIDVYCRQAERRKLKLSQIPPCGRAA